MVDWNAKVIQVIRTELTLAGEGTKESPMRRIVQYWSLDGDLLAEWDPRNPGNVMPTTEGR